MLQVRRTGEGLFEVTVSAAVETIHQVSLDEEYYRRLAGEEETPERLIERSFEFLLRHEPNTSILRSFHLKEINRYFPDFESEICG